MFTNKSVCGDAVRNFFRICRCFTNQLICSSVSRFIRNNLEPLIRNVVLLRVIVRAYICSQLTIFIPIGYLSGTIQGCERLLGRNGSKLCIEGPITCGTGRKVKDLILKDILLELLKPTFESKSSLLSSIENDLGRFHVVSRGILAFRFAAVQYVFDCVVNGRKGRGDSHIGSGHIERSLGISSLFNPFFRIDRSAVYGVTLRVGNDKLIKLITVGRVSGYSNFCSILSRAFRNSSHRPVLNIFRHYD